TLSNHASGTSIDLNATEHPLGARDTFTDDQVAAIRAILAEVAPVVAWGGDFDGRADEMPFEIVGDRRRVAEVAARLSGQ
ncbi:M15 family metallopeptidase, partial [Bacillus licheniformis]